MKVPLLDLKAQLDTIRPEMVQALTDVLDSTHYIMGAPVTELEKQIADYCSVEHAIGLSSGTDALLIALMALDVKPGDLVITTPYSFLQPRCCGTSGSAAVFVDIEAETFNLDPVCLKEWFEKNPTEIKKVKAIIPVHLFGQCADLDPILDIAEKIISRYRRRRSGDRSPLSFRLRRIEKSRYVGPDGLLFVFPEQESRRYRRRRHGCH
jgi:dTDP-4-amino-4,6-dideoxygalactose transaminase